MGNQLLGRLINVELVRLSKLKNVSVVVVWRESAFHLDRFSQVINSCLFKV